MLVTQLLCAYVAAVNMQGYKALDFRDWITVVLTNHHEPHNVSLAYSTCFCHMNPRTLIGPNPI